MLCELLRCLSRYVSGLVELPESLALHFDRLAEEFHYPILPQQQGSWQHLVHKLFFEAVFQHRI